MIHIHQLARRGGRIVAGTLFNPPSNQRNLVLTKWSFSLRHAGGFTVRGYLLDQVARLRVPRIYSRLPTLASRQQCAEFGHHVITARLGRLMATVAVFLEDWSNLAIVADLPTGIFGGIIREQGGGGAKRHEDRGDHRGQRV